MIKTSAVVFTPAKINLALAVTDRMANGYHGLETVFQSVSLYDTVSVRVTDEGLSCLCGQLSGENNLAYKAAQIYLDHYNRTQRPKFLAGIEIRIEKRIPLQAGLGGGSSDAAAVLRALNHLFSNHFAQEDLLTFANQCGSDTAFFLRGGTQWGSGTGTTLSDLPFAPEMDIILVKGPDGISTAEAYKSCDEIGEFSNLDQSRWIQLLSQKKIEEIAQNLTNSLEKAAFKLLPKIEQIKELLIENGCYGALMSGSGSTVFGVLRDREHGEKVAEVLKKYSNYNTWVVKTISEMPLIASK